MTRRSLAPLLVATALLPALTALGCREERAGTPTPPPPPPADAATGSDAGARRDAGAPDPGDAAPDAAPLDGGPGAAEPVVVAAWNLHNFSVYGTREFRIDAIATQLRELASDVTAVEELKVEDGSNGEGPQAWDALLERLPELEGVHNPYDTFDTTVGLLVRRETTTLLDWRTILTGDRNAFPRPPLDATVRVVRGATDVTFHVVVVHLKAFADSVDRRRAACAMLRAYVEAQPERDYVLVGDWNDDPYDPPADNSFVGTFLDAEPDWVFLTAALPPESVTSVGYYHQVGGVSVTGELLDHAIATGALLGRFARAVPSIVARPEAEFADWEATRSDHFPIVVRFEP